MIPHTIIEGPADWTSEGLVGKEDTYTYQFTAQDVAEVKHAVQKLKLRVSTEEDVKQVNFERLSAERRNAVASGCLPLFA